MPDPNNEKFEEAFEELSKRLGDLADFESDPLSLNDADAIDLAVRVLADFQREAALFVLGAAKSANESCCLSHMVGDHMSRWLEFINELDWPTISKSYMTIQKHHNS